MPSIGITRSNAEPAPTPRSIEVALRPPHVIGYAAIVSLYGEHDLSTSAELTAALAPLDGNLLIDMSACEFIDSSVITALLGKSHELIREGHRLELLVPSGNRMVGRVVDVVGLRTLVPVHAQLPATGTGLELDATASHSSVPG